MSRNTIYTLNGHLPYFYVYKCSKCGKVNAVAAQFNYSTRISKPTRILASSKEEQKRKVELEFQDMMSDHLNERIDRINNHNFRALGVGGTCEQCGHVQAWSRLSQYDASYSNLKTRLLLIGSITFMLVVFMGLLGLVSLIPKTLLVALVVAIVVGGYSWYADSKYEKKLQVLEKEVSGMFAENLPFAARQPELVQAKLQRL